MKSLVIGTITALTATTSALAQVPTLQNFPIVQKSNFTCAPRLRTYIVKPLDNRQGFGIRCVKLSEEKSGTTIPRIPWYGEGNWGGAKYCHFGQAIYRGSNLIGFASDIHGNGEDINNDFPKNIQIKILNTSTIHVNGAWSEE